jgi:hypothetical protein
MASLPQMEAPPLPPAETPWAPATESEPPCAEGTLGAENQRAGEPGGQPGGPVMQCAGVQDHVLPSSVTRGLQ